MKQKKVTYKELPISSKILAWIFHLMLYTGLIWVIVILLKGLMRALGSC